jgi:sugar lactone lactonase YvrE
MHTAANHIYALVGGRWAGEYIRDFRMNIYDGLTWRSIDEYVVDGIANLRILDPVSIAVDPQDAGHFFVATYGTGVLEFRDYTLTQRYTYTNSTLKPVNATIEKPEYYTRTDGAMLDEQGNLWVLNATDIGQPLHILSPNGQWHALRLYPNGTNLTFSTPSGIWVDRRSTKRKWMFDQRSTQGVILLDDGGTPFSSGDDRCVKRSEFIDHNGKLIAPSTFQCFAQDHNDRIWIGTEKGLFLLKAETDFFTSNACYRIIIPRNDGTGLGDYLMGDEQINCMAVDGGNRMWIGTAGSGLYLIEDDTITVAHFTETNSLLPSNRIQSITIHPTTGEVFVGTDNGIASYRSDASEAQETMENAYAYPNPVRPGYSGVITITGLMDNSEVRIIDSGGNLVCKTRSHGGTAVWDGKDAYGKRATPGIYTALCNTTGGHTAVKIMFIP